MSSYDNVFVLDHPLVQNKLAIIRDINTKDKQFREVVAELAILIFYEASRDLKLENKNITTPICGTVGRVIKDEIAIVSILRAAIGMENGILQMVPNVKVGHVGLYRDPKTLTPVEYYCKLPNYIAERKIFLLDPMLATGGSADAAIKSLKSRGTKDITFLCLISAPEGIKRISLEYPNGKIYTTSIDDKLNGLGYILPGLGDAGDRLFGTK